MFYRVTHSQYCVNEKSGKRGTGKFTNGVH